TLLISAIGIVPDVHKTVTMDLKRAGNSLYLVGSTQNRLGGSHYNLVNGIEGGTVPQPNPKAIETYRALHKAIQAGLVQSCHDVSGGGLAVALAEMCIAARLGADVSKVDASEPVSFLFSETQSCFVVEVTDEAAFRAIMDGVSVCDRIGYVTADGEVVFQTEGGTAFIRSKVAEFEWV